MNISKTNISSVTQNVASPSTVDSKPGNKFIDALRDFQSQWKDANQKAEAVSNQLPNQVKAMVDVQLSINRLQMQSMTVSKAAESLSSSAKRILQGG